MGAFRLRSSAVLMQIIEFVRYGGVRARFSFSTRRSEICLFFDEIQKKEPRAFIFKNDWLIPPPRDGWLERLVRNAADTLGFAKWRES